MASAGVVARDHDGTVLLTAWKVLRNCNSREEAEAEPCLHELRLAVDWLRQLTIGGVRLSTVDYSGQSKT
jgi:hypothetical protein